jgi:tetratricopeptide (TPR) repeat protein
MGRRKYADQGLAVIQGFNMGRQVVKDFQDDQVRAEVGDAAQANRATESMSGNDAAAVFNKQYVPQDGGPATAAEYLQQNPGVAAALSPDRQAGYVVGKDSFDNRASAKAKANGLNVQGMADVMALNGKPEEAMRLQQQARQGDLTELQIKGAERGEREAAVEEEYKLSRQKLAGEFSGNRIRGDNDALMSQYEQEKSAYQEALKANPDNPAAAGIAPTKPKLRTMTGLDMLHDANLIMQHDMKFGKVDPAKALQYQQMVGQVKKEVSVDAFKLLHSGDVKGAVKAFEDQGDLRLPEGATVEARKGFYEVGGQKVPTNELVVHLANGHVQVINGLQGMDALDAADKIIGNNFKGAELGISKQRVGLEGARVGLANKAEARAQAEFDAGAPDRSLKSTVSTLQLGLANASTDEERTQISAKLKAIQSGMGADKNSPSEVKLAKSLVDSGLAKDMKEGLQIAMSKSGQSPTERHLDLVKQFSKDDPNPNRAIEKANQIMVASGFVKSGSSWSQSDGASAATPAPAQLPAPEQRKIGQSYDTPKGKLIWRGTGWEQPTK